MSNEALQTSIQGFIEPVINSLGLELVDIELKKMPGKALLRVYIDKDQGVQIRDCERVSREIEGVLDVEDPIPYSYVLEVSSPGLDRPLKSVADYKRYVGKTVKVITLHPIDNQNHFVGRLDSAGDREISVVLEKNRTVAVPYDNISRARLEVEI